MWQLVSTQQGRKFKEVCPYPIICSKILRIDRAPPSCSATSGCTLECMKILKIRLVEHPVGDYLSHSPPARQAAIYLQFFLPGSGRHLSGTLPFGTKVHKAGNLRRHLEHFQRHLHYLQQRLSSHHSSDS